MIPIAIRGPYPDGYQRFSGRINRREPELGLHDNTLLNFIQPGSSVSVDGLSSPVLGEIKIGSYMKAKLIGDVSAWTVESVAGILITTRKR